MASRIDAPELASAALRKLIQEAVAVCLCGLPTCDSCRREGEANVTLRYALPALADIVKFVEDLSHEPCHWQPMHVKGRDETCTACRSWRTLAALRAQLGKKP